MQSLYITVFDKDYGKSNDYLGGLILGGSGSKGGFYYLWLTTTKDNIFRSTTKTLAGYDSISGS